MQNDPSGAGGALDAPGDLWSLCDFMERLRLDYFWQSASEVADSIATIFNTEAETGEPWKELSSEERAGLVKRLTKLRRLCSVVGLTASCRLLDIALETLPKSMGEMNMLWMSVRSEMKDKLFLHVPPHLAKFYERDDFMQEAARAAFPQANQELREAGNSISAGLPTACVFHAMRAVEYGLNSLAAEVSVNVDAKNWQNVIDQIEKAIKELWPKLPAGPDKNDYIHFLSQAASEFRYFKDGWRNHVSHNKVKYTEPQAIKIMTHAADFIEALSPRLREAP